MSTRPSIDGFRHGDEWRELHEPDSLATARQLMWLNANGRLTIVADVTPISKGEAAYAIDAAGVSRRER